MNRTPLLVLLAALAACAPAPPAMTPPAAPVLGVDPALEGRLDTILTAAIAERTTPGAAVAVGRRGGTALLRGWGRTDWADAAPAVDERTVYDLASLTKVIGTTTAAMILEEEGRLDLDRAVRDYLPEFDDPAKAAITPRLLLVHRGGMEAFAPLYQELRGRERYLEAINRRPLRGPPGAEMVYSDWDLILLQLIVERVTGQTLDAFLEQRVFGPLGMTDTRFNPPAEWRARVAPTEVQEFRGGQVHGEVHDENAWAIGGVAGHAGLFSSARDLAVFARMMLNGGTHDGVRILQPETVARWTARQGAEDSRALGWDTPSRGSSAGRYLSARAFGHTGFTGTSIWIDPETDLFVVLLTNRVNPTRDNPRLGPVRRAVVDAAAEAVADGPLADREAR